MAPTQQRPAAAPPRVEGQALDWPGKARAGGEAAGPSRARLVPVPESSERGALPRHWLLEGDNLDALKLLAEELSGGVDLIYIDPPYNTGKRFVYGDRFESHAAWLSMMYPRLLLARELLSQDGSLFVSIDDTELPRLRLLLDEVFGEQNFLGVIVWQTATDNNATQIAREHEYVVGYALDRSRQGRWSRPSERARAILRAHAELVAQHGDDPAAVQRELGRWIREAQRRGEPDLSGVAHYRFVDERGVFYPGNPANTRPGGYEFEVPHPRTGRPCARPSNGFRWPEATFRAALERGDVLWGEDERVIPKIKKRLETATELLRSTWYEDNRASTRALARLMGGKVFENPKSVGLLARIIRFAAGPDASVLDFFAGSGSTGEAVLRLNAEDGGARRFVLVQSPEPTPAGSVARRLGYETIADIALERIRRARAAVGAREDEGIQHSRIARGATPHAPG